MMIEPLCINTLLPFPMLPPTARPKQHSVICRCTLTPILSSPIPSPGPHFHSHTLTLAPDCFFPEPSVSLAVCFPSYYMDSKFFSRVGSTLLKLSGRPICVKNKPGFLGWGILLVALQKSQSTWPRRWLQSHSSLSVVLFQAHFHLPPQNANAWHLWLILGVFMKGQVFVWSSQEEKQSWC